MDDPENQGEEDRTENCDQEEALEDVADKGACCGLVVSPLLLDHKCRVNRKGKVHHRREDCQRNDEEVSLKDIVLVRNLLAPPHLGHASIELIPDPSRNKEVPNAEIDNKIEG